MKFECNYEILICAEVRDLFRTWRENNERRSKDVMDLWDTKLMSKIDQLGNESMIN